MTIDFRRETVAGLAARVRAREVSARELTAAALDRIEATNPAANAFVAVDADAALEEADRVDGQLAARGPVGLLAGIPIGVKDLEDATGFVTTRGSVVSADDPPAGVDSVLVSRLRRAGCVVLGKTNTPELGCKGDTVNDVFGATRNPWNLDRSAGGSSGGSAAAVAAGMVPLASGSDGGGSIRIPASLCGLSGFKPSLGRVPTGGDTPPGWADLSCKGPIARTVRDTALVLDEVIGPEPTDLRALPLPGVSWRAALDHPHPPRRVVWSPTLGYAPVDPEVLAVCEAAVRRLEDLGTEVVNEPSVFPVDPIEPWLVLTGTGHLRTVAELRGTDDWERLDPVVRGSAEWAEKLSPVDVLEAQDAAHLLNLTLVALFRTSSLLLCPTVAAQAPAPGENGVLDGEPDANWIRFTYPFNLTRSPAGTVCAGYTSDGMPVGLQVIGPQHGDVVVLRAMALLEDTLDLDPIAPLS